MRVPVRRLVSAARPIGVWLMCCWCAATRAIVAIDDVSCVAVAVPFIAMQLLVLSLQL